MKGNNMNTRIKNLMDQLNASNGNSEYIEQKLQLEWNKVFQDYNALNTALKNAEQASEYSFDDNGEIVSWYRWYDLKSYTDCKPYLENYVQETACMTIDWDNDCFVYPQGECLIIQDDTRHDNGVWLNSKCVIKESEYLDNYQEVDDNKRDSLIEAWMEANGYFPGVFRVDSYANVFLHNTKKKGK